MLQLHRGLQKLQRRIGAARLKHRDKMLEALGRLKGKCPKATPLVRIKALPERPTTLTWT